VTLVNNSAVNASSTAGGQVYVYGGLIPLIGEDKGLWAAVLSHETAHTGQRHQVKLYIQREYNERMVEYYRARVQAGDKSAGYALLAFQVSSALLLKRMEREQEHEADQRGMLIMARAGYHPDFVFALHHLLLMNSPDESKFRAFFSDHPRWETRDQRSDRVYANALAEFNRLWPDAAASPGGSPPVVAFLGKPVMSENRQEGFANLKIPLYCRNSQKPLDIVVMLQKDNRRVKALDPAFADQKGDFVLHQRAECVDKDDAVPVSIHIPAKAISSNDRSVKAEVAIASDIEPIAMTKSFDLHLPKVQKQDISMRDAKNVVHDPKPSPAPSPSVALKASLPSGSPVVSPVVEQEVPSQSTASIAEGTTGVAANLPVPPATQKLQTVKTLTSSPAKSESASTLPMAVTIQTPKAGVLGVTGANWSERGASGVEILDIALDSPADIAGLHVHEVITDVNGRRIRSTQDLAAMLAQNEPGSKITLGYIFRSNLGWMPKEEVIILANK
jgi:hypothetical protein